MPAFIDRTGQRFGALVVKERATGSGLRRRTRWLCQCDCGETSIVEAASLVGGLTTSCGCGIHKHAARARDLTGRRYGKLTVIECTGRDLVGQFLWRCQCDCGGERTSTGRTLNMGHATSCGCGRRGLGSTRTDGKRTPTYHSWQNMISRCTQPSSPAFAHYQKRGITVCERWRSFDNFLADMGERPNALTIERIDNNGDYEPGNCRWATKREQGNNRITNIHFHYRGVDYTLANLARATGTAKETLRARLVRPGGWNVEDAVNTPAIPRHLRRAGLSKRQ